VITVRISRRTLRVLSWTAVSVAIIGGLYILGTAVTPVDAESRPLVLSPSLRTAEKYRTRTEAWVVAMAQIDKELTDLLSADVTTGAAELYAQSQRMQRIGEDAAALVQTISVAESPVAMVGLYEQAREAAQAYLDTALSTAYWVGAPSTDSRREALEMLRIARALRVTLENSPWLATN